MSDNNNRDDEFRENVLDEVKQEPVVQSQEVVESEQQNQTTKIAEEEIGATATSNVAATTTEEQQEQEEDSGNNDDGEDVFEDELSLSERRGRKYKAPKGSASMMGSVASGRKFRRNSDVSMQSNALTDDDESCTSGMDGGGSSENDRKLLFESYQRRAMMEKTFDMHNSSNFDADGVSNRIVEEEKDDEEKQQQQQLPSIENPQDPSIPPPPKEETKVMATEDNDDDDDDSIKITNYNSDGGSSYATSIINDIFEDEPSEFGLGRKKKNKKKKPYTFLQSSTSMKRPTLFTSFRSRAKQQADDFYEKNSNSCDDTVLANMENELRKPSGTKRTSFSSLLSGYSNRENGGKNIIMLHLLLMLTIFASMSVMILVFLYYENGMISLGQAFESKAEKLGAAVMRKSPNPP